ncbi:MAG: SGNH/GDSL hydrolase family protein [Betaproteobacteria bacterium]|nr:SGNH/GDSL hydrolase family protein [Betaproteobacteria bacterium]
MKINSRGWRDREHAVNKPEREYRIAVLGDSFAEALQVDLKDTFWSLLPERLARCGLESGKRIEAINLGVSGYGTAQQLLTLRRRVWEYAPDLVLVAFFPGNDVRNNSRALEPDRLRPFFVIKDGQLALDDSFAPTRASGNPSAWTSNGRRCGVCASTSSHASLRPANYAFTTTPRSPLRSPRAPTCRRHCWNRGWTRTCSASPRIRPGARHGPLPRSCWSRCTMRRGPRERDSCWRCYRAPVPSIPMPGYAGAMPSRTWRNLPNSI